MGVVYSGDSFYFVFVLVGNVLFVIFVLLVMLLVGYMDGVVVNDLFVYLLFFLV